MTILRSVVGEFVCEYGGEAYTITAGEALYDDAFAEWALYTYAPRIQVVQP